MTTTELIELLKKYERGGATGRPREVMFEIGNRIIDTDGIEVTGSGDGLVTELYLSLPSAHPDLDEWCTDCREYDHEHHCCPRFNRVIREALEEIKPEQKTGHWIPILRASENDEYRCSVCSQPMGFDYDYCPHCGARMIPTTTYPSNSIN